MKRLPLLVGCLIFLCTPLALSIAPEQTATKAAGMSSSLAEPVKITPFILRTDASHPGRSALGNGSWVNQPLVQVENTSGKAIEYLALEISFPGAESLSDNLPLMLAYGQAPGGKHSAKQAEALQPGAKVNLTVGRNACDAVKSRLLANGTQPPSGSRATVRINGVIFADKTAWFDGLLHVADRENPLRWYVAGKSPSQGDLKSALQFKMAKAGYSANLAAAASAPQMCWDRIGTEWIACCDGFPRMASAILVQVFGGIYEPHVMSLTCPDGSACEWIKAVGCSTW